LKNWK
jgi:hypothetical protein